MGLLEMAYHSAWPVVGEFLETSSLDFFSLPASCHVFFIDGTFLIPSSSMALCRWYPPHLYRLRSLCPL